MTTSATERPEGHPLADIIPALPPGAPTLARHLRWALDTIARKVPGAVDSDDFDAARQVLAGLPGVPSGTVAMEGRTFWREEDGRLTPENLVRAEKLLEDAFVRAVAGGALAISASLSRFKVLSFSEASALIDAIARDYGVQIGGKAGNTAFFTFDRAFKVQIQVQERVTVGPTIQIAKEALNEYLREADASDEVKAIINSAFGLDDQGRVRVAELVRLKRLNIQHSRWRAAMAAIDDAMETAGKAIYLRVYRRREDGRFDLIPLDLASA
ncbi:DUF3164 family protein [Azospirillum halopraeferens]|uniref:DUF3164 family protein n=1 Tax=Azospirillum halopraeferens TaxID=34010 RepID=UPI00041B7EF5|nr:DUF3164 family protein [Azospirillum halopraeferens]